jgi:hypothetical protein
MNTDDFGSKQENIKSDFKYEKIMTSNIAHDELAVIDSTLCLVFDSKSILNHFTFYDPGFDFHKENFLKSQKYYATIIESSEMKNIPKHKLSILSDTINNHDFKNNIDVNAIGLSDICNRTKTDIDTDISTNICVIIVIISDVLRKFRKKLDLPKKLFHIVMDSIDKNDIRLTAIKTKTQDTSKIQNAMTLNIIRLDSCSVLKDVLVSMYKCNDDNIKMLGKSEEYLDFILWLMLTHNDKSNNDKDYGNEYDQVLENLLCKLFDHVRFKNFNHVRDVMSCFLRDRGFIIGLYYALKHSQTLKTSEKSIIQRYDDFVKSISTNNHFKVRNHISNFTGGNFQSNHDCKTICCHDQYLYDSDKIAIESILKTLNYPLLDNHKWLYQMNCERHRTYKYYDVKFVSTCKGNLRSTESFQQSTESCLRSTICYFESVESPRNFSFVTDILSGSSIPKKSSHIRFFHKVGIDRIITLMENKLSDNLRNEMRTLGIRYNFFEVADREPMTTDQMIKILNLVRSKDSKKVVIHCKGGVGRTATALAACLMANGKTREESMIILNKRNTILSKTQKDFLKDWKSYTLSGKFEINLLTT